MFDLLIGLAFVAMILAPCVFASATRKGTSEEDA
jgi:hypothetical protein